MFHAVLLFIYYFYNYVELYSIKCLHYCDIGNGGIKNYKKNFLNILIEIVLEVLFLYVNI